MVVHQSEMLMEGIETEGVGKEELALRLVNGDELDWFLQNYRTDIPELLHTAARQLNDYQNKERETLMVKGKV